MVIIWIITKLVILKFWRFILNPKSKGNMLQVAGGGWSSPIYGIETAQMRRGCRTELCLETQLCRAAGRSWGGWEGKALSNMPTRAEGQCFSFPLHRMRRPVLPMWSVWALVLLLECVSSWDRCLVQGALRSLICLSISCALLMCQGRNLPFRASLLWCHFVLLPTWSYPLKTWEYVSLNIYLKSTDTSVPV